MVDKLKNFAYNTYVDVAKNFVSQPNESVFIEKGILTIKEFIEAGDTLVQKCPTWEWAGCDDPKKLKKEFPADKQYLITRKMPCQKRLKEVQMAAEEVGEVDVGDGWNEIGDINAGQKEANKDEEMFDLDQEMNNKAQVVGEKEQEQPAVDDEEPMDLDDMMEAEEKGETNIFATGQYVVQEVEEETKQGQGISKCRKYDLSINYDFYHQTPRLWLLGYDDDGNLLSQAQMFEDIMSDYAQKTVTYEEHPFDSTRWLSIHPCNHAKVMKKIIDTVVANGGNPEPQFCLFIFLKFIANVIPTIEYDFTVNVDLE